MVREFGTVVEDVVRDLREYDELVARLEDPEAIHEPFPTDDPEYPVEVVVTPIFGGSNPHRGAVTRTYRLQVTVSASQAWREKKSQEVGTTATTAMHSILSLIADRLDLAKADSPEVPVGGEDTRQAPEETDAGRVQITGDWLIRGTYLTDDGV